MMGGRLGSLALVLLLAASCDAFLPAPAAVWGRGAALPRGARRAACGPRMMSDMGDMTMEMMRRLQKSMHELSPQDLAKLKALCEAVSAKADEVSKAGRSPSPAPAKKAAAPALRDGSPVPTAKPFVIGAPKASADVVAENDAFFGIDDTPVDEAGEPIKKKGEQKEALMQKNKIPQPQPKNLKESPTEGTKRFSKYLPDERPEIAGKKLATDEAIIDEDTWNEEYIKVFGRPPNDDPITDIDELTSPKGINDPNDSFQAVRAVQANAGSYPTPQEYYDALNAAMTKWKQDRMAQGKTIGSAASERYISQLANSSPDSANFQKFGEEKKFTLDCMLNPVDAKDEKGATVTVLQFTQIDEKGTTGLAGCQVGEALTMLHGVQVNSFEDLNQAISSIHKQNLGVVEATVQGPKGPREVTLRGL